MVSPVGPSGVASSARRVSSAPIAGEGRGLNTRR
jgi:hypothetical protein